jgi:prepilin signal peptidase PulO-like enzyme (type II secretory pathway)
VVIIGLLCASIAVRNELIKGCLAASLCVYVVILLSLAIGSAIDWRYSVLLNQGDEWALPYAEVQFCGSRRGSASVFPLLVDGEEPGYCMFLRCAFAWPLEWL